jgi:hypothetical protein
MKENYINIMDADKLTRMADWNTRAAKLSERQCSIGMLYDRGL